MVESDLRPFEIDIRLLDDAPDVAQAKVVGYLDAHTVVDFEREMEGQLSKGVLKFILDMDGLGYISSAGIGALMRLVQVIEQHR